MQKKRQLLDDTTTSDVLELACEPIPLVRIAFLGLGKRGKESINHFMYIEGVEIKIICDLDEENLSFVRELMIKHGKKSAIEYNNKDDWQEICRRDDIDLIYVCTSRELHTIIAVNAMKNGKHVALEVPAANTLAECWELVNTAEKYRRHCIMLENCCYGFFEMSVLNMCQQGLMGEIFHVEGSYIHDLRNINFDKRTSYSQLWFMQGNPYPTHGLGPICQVLDIHRGDKLSWLTSVSSGQFTYPTLNNHVKKDKYSLGNINTTIIKTYKNKTIIIQHDISSPRPYNRRYLISGEKGFALKGDPLSIILSEESNKTVNELLTQYEHIFYKEKGELARKVGTHDGMDFIMDYRLIYCLRNGLPLDMDVYDAAEWSSIIELSERSVMNNSMPVNIPDFTRGQWNKLKKLHFW